MKCDFKIKPTPAGWLVNIDLNGEGLKLIDKDRRKAVIRASKALIRRITQKVKEPDCGKLIRDMTDKICAMEHKYYSRN